MHHSRLCTLVLDCHSDDLEAATQFWSRALGKPIVTTDQDGDGKYAELQTAPDEIRILLQRVDHDSRVHLDIETDDIEAEVRRLERLGAKRIQAVRTWWVMEAPTGQRFCVVRASSKSFAERATAWS
jgi:predicted enzyme related to lactoylglutathione lyase